MFEAGVRVRVKDVYPFGREDPLPNELEQRGKLGTVMINPYQDRFIVVLLDENKSNPNTWGLYYPEELEVVDA